MLINSRQAAIIALLAGLATSDTPASGGDHAADGPESSVRWNSIPSMAETNTHVEQELARALAARDSAQTNRSSHNARLRREDFGSSEQFQAVCCKKIADSA